MEPILGVNRRTFLAAAAACLASGFAAIASPPKELLEFVEREVPIEAAARPQCLRLLHLSDFHASAFVSLRYLDEVISLAVQQEYDCVCLTGDFITTNFSAWNEYAALLRKLSSRSPVFASLGNHDGGAWAKKHGGPGDTSQVRRLLNDAGVKLLDNASATMEAHGWRLRLVGVGDLWSGEFRPEQAFAVPLQPPADLTVVLCHNPDSKDRLGGYAWDLLLCGHTHGGEVALPFIGSPMAPVDDQRFISGLHRWQGRWIYISKGIGSLYGFRIDCPGDFTLLRLRATS